MRPSRPGTVRCLLNLSITPTHAPHSLYVCFNRPCAHISDPPHSLHLHFRRPCGHTREPSEARGTSLTNDEVSPLPRALPASGSGGTLLTPDAARIRTAWKLKKASFPPKNQKKFWEAPNWAHLEFVVGVVLAPADLGLPPFFSENEFSITPRGFHNASHNAIPGHHFRILTQRSARNRRRRR